MPFPFFDLPKGTKAGKRKKKTPKRKYKYTPDVIATFFNIKGPIIKSTAIAGLGARNIRRRKKDGRRR